MTARPTARRLSARLFAPLALLALLVSAPASADEPEPLALGKLACASFKAPADVTARCDAAAKAEGVLLDTYTQALDALHGPERVALVDDHAAWVASRGPFCLAVSDGPMSERDFPTTADDFECLAASATQRERLTRAWLPPAPGQPTTLDGAYDDGWGGSMTISPAQGGEAKFGISVVRGATFHTGEVDGTLIVAKDGQSATATIDTVDGSPCVLTFALAPNRATVSESKTCDHFHGARAYFDGTYRKVPAPDSP